MKNKEIYPHLKIKDKDIKWVEKYEIDPNPTNPRRGTCRNCKSEVKIKLGDYGCFCCGGTFPLSDARHGATRCPPCNKARIQKEKQ